MGTGRLITPPPRTTPRAMLEVGEYASFRFDRRSKSTGALSRTDKVVKFYGKIYIGLYTSNR